MKILDIISFIAIVIASVGLALLKITGMTGHIAISVIALVIIIACTIIDRKNWKNPLLEIGYRLFYFITLITGILMIAAHLYGFIGILHKISAAVFAILYICNFVNKILKTNKNS